jgi:hypothetical protein
MHDWELRALIYRSAVLPNSTFVGCPSHNFLSTTHHFVFTIALSPYLIFVFYSTLVSLGIRLISA